MNYPKPKYVRYHYEIGLPNYVGEMCLEFFMNFAKVNTTFHSANQLIDEMKGAIPLPTKVDLLNPNNTLVELYEQVDAHDAPARVMQKAVIRVHHLNDTKDYTYVVARDGYLISAWANAKTDIHRLKSRDVYFSSFTKEHVEVPQVLLDNTGT